MSCQRVVLCQIEVVEQLIHTAVQTDIAAEVEQHTEKPVVLLITFVALPNRRDSPHRATFAEQVQYQQISVLHILYHFRARILRPTLYYPGGFRIHFLHSRHDGLSGCIEIYRSGIFCFVEGVHRVIIRLAEKLLLLPVIQIGYLGKTSISRLQESRTGKAIPQIGLGQVQSQLLVSIMRNHSGISRKYRFDAILTHAIQYFLLQSFLLCVPRVRIGTAPSFQIIHGPPSQEGGAGYKAVYFFFGISQFLEHIEPDTLLPYGGQRKIDAMQGHPVYFFLPALPIPESHRIRVGAIVEIITK